MLFCQKNDPRVCKAGQSICHNLTILSCPVALKYFCSTRQVDEKVWSGMILSDSNGMLTNVNDARGLKCMVRSRFLPMNHYFDDFLIVRPGHGIQPWVVLSISINNSLKKAGLTWVAEPSEILSNLTGSLWQCILLTSATTMWYRRGWMVPNMEGSYIFDSVFRVVGRIQVPGNVSCMGKFQGPGINWRSMQPNSLWDYGRWRPWKPKS